MERNLLRQRVLEGVKAARAQGRTPPRHDRGEAALRPALMADRTRSIPAICREVGELPASTLYHYLAADGTLKSPDRRVLDA